MSVLAFIPARGGSKRIPGKNLADVWSRERLRSEPLWLSAVHSAKPCTWTVLSTDLDVSPALVSEHRIAVHRRKPEHATDDAQIEPAMLDYVRNRPHVETVVLLQPTSPFRTAVHVAEALALLTPEFDSVVSVCRDPGYRFMGRTTTEGSYRPYRPDLGYRPRSQERDIHCPVRENGAIYVVRRSILEQTGLRMGGRMRAYEMSVRDSWEIDEPWELEAARAIARCP